MDIWANTIHANGTKERRMTTELEKKKEEEQEEQEKKKSDVLFEINSDTAVIYEGDDNYLGNLHLLEVSLSIDPIFLTTGRGYMFTEIGRDRNDIIARYQTLAQSRNDTGDALPPAPRPIMAPTGREICAKPSRNWGGERKVA